MMIKIIATILLWSQCAYAGLPPTTVKGQTDVGAKVKFQFQAPHNQITDLGGVSGLIETGNTNVLPDPGFEAATSLWTASGGATATPNTTAKGTGVNGYDWDSNASSQTLVSASITIPNGFKSNNGFVSCNIKTVSGTATYTLTVDDGTNNLVTPVTVNSSTATFAQTSLNFIYPASGSIRLKLTSVSSNEPEIYIDDCFLGSAVNVATVAPQAILMGTVKVTGCAAVWSTTSTTYATFATQTGCSYAVTKNALAPTTNIPAIRFASLPAGDYLLQAEGRIENNIGNQASFFQFYDGTTSAIEESAIASSTSAVGVVPSINQSISYSAPQTNVTLQVRSRVTSGGTANLNGLSTYPLVIKVWYFPSSSQQLVSSANADYSGSTYSLTASNTQGFGTPTGSCSHDRVGGNLLLNCKFTSGTVTASEARINLPSVLVSADATRIPSISIVGQLENGLIGSIGQSVGSSASVLIEPSVGYVTFSSRSSSTTGFTKLTGSGLTGSTTTVGFFASIPIQGWSSSQRAPTLIGSVTTNASSAYKIESAAIGASGSTACTSSPCTIGWQSGSWISSVTRSTTGTYTVNFTSGMFSAAPSCFLTNYSSSGACKIDTLESISSFGVNCYTLLNANTDMAFRIMCMGPR